MLPSAILPTSLLLLLLLSMPPPPPEAVMQAALLGCEFHIACSSWLSSKSSVVSATPAAQNGPAVTCGKVATNSGLTVAKNGVPRGSLCGKQVKMLNTENGKSVKVTVVAECASCSQTPHFDLSASAFTALADMPVGTLSSGN